MSRVSCSRRSPRGTTSDPGGCSARALSPPLPLHAQCGGLEGRRTERLGFVSLLLYTLRASSSQLSGQRTSYLPRTHCPGALP